MGRYKVTQGQNLYDIALHVHGSIEGIVDLLINNPALSTDDDLKAGDELDFTDGFVINADVVAYNTTHDIIPASGERKVYPKNFTGPLMAQFYLPSERNGAVFFVFGKGTMEIDWGDNSAPQTIVLTGSEQNITHYFDHKTSRSRRIRIYGDFELNTFNISEMQAEDIYMLLPLTVLHTVLHKSSCSLEFFRLLPELRTLDLQGCKINDLSALLDCKLLTALDLSGCTLPRQVADDYLTGLAAQHYGRAACRVTLTTQPSGQYFEPPRDEGLNYIITGGMEAVWLLTHEPAWNETGIWEFNINNTVYRYEQNN